MRCPQCLSIGDRALRHEKNVATPPKGGGVLRTAHVRQGARCFAPHGGTFARKAHDNVEWASLLRNFATDAHSCIMARIQRDPSYIRMWRDDPIKDHRQGSGFHLVLFCSQGQAIVRRRQTRGGRGAGRWLDPTAGLNGKKERRIALSRT
jgi:hypothetical protein